MKTTSIRQLVILIITTLVFIACSGPRRINANLPNEHTTQNSLDWAGVYSGSLPCADCGYIDTELVLNVDKTYTLSTIYGKKNVSHPEIINGKFAWIEGQIKLEGIVEGTRPTMYKVEENQIRQLDMQGKEIKGDLAQQYVLKKNGNRLVEDKEWKIVEINGKEIKGSAENYYIIFHSKDGRVEAKANCNVLLNTYKIRNELQLSIKPGISTMMACPDNTEQELIQVLSEVDNLSTNGEYLMLNKGRMAPLVRLELAQD